MVAPSECPRADCTPMADRRRMPPLLYDGPLHREWRQRVVTLEGYGMPRGEAEVWAAEELGLLPVAGERS